MRRADNLYRVILWMAVCSECCVLSGSGLCEGLFPCTEESYGCLYVVRVVGFTVEVCATC